MLYSSVQTIEEEGKKEKSRIVHHSTIIQYI